MEITRVNAGANCYIVSEKGKAIVIDCGLKGKEKKLIEECKGKTVTLIVLTHGHMDHAQNAKVLSEALHAPVAIHERDLRLVRNPKHARMESKGILNGIVRFFSVLTTKHCEPLGIEPSILLKEGDSLKPYGIDASVVELPGHTRGSIGIKGKDVLFAGDAMFHMFRPGIAGLYEDRETMLQSVAKIEKMGPCRLYVGHGAPMENRRWL